MSAGRGSVVSQGFSDGTRFDIYAGAASLLPDDEKQKARMLWQLLGDAKAFKQQCGFAEATENWQFWLGNQWKKIRPPQYSMAVVNEIFGATETFIGHFADSIPESVARPRAREHEQIGQTVTKLLNWADDVNSLQTFLELPLRSAVITGTAALSVEWNPQLDRFRGRPQYRFVDEGFIFLSPHSTCVEDADYILEARNVPLGWIRKAYPDRFPMVMPGIWDGSLTPLQRDVGMPGSKWQAFTTTDGSSTQFTSETNKRYGAKGMATLIDAWIRQDNGTLRHMVCANGVMLADEPSPYEDGEMYPYVLFNVLRAKNHPYGHSLVSFVKRLQMELNEMHSYALDQQRYESDSPLVISIANKNEGTRPKNSPGSIYYDADPRRNGYYLLQKPGANPQWMPMQDHVVKRMRDITGNVDILRGERPVGVSTLGGMEIVRDEANVLVSKMNRQALGAIREKDRRVIYRLKQFMKDNRSIRITGRAGATEYVEMNPSQGLNPQGEITTAQTIPDDFEADVDFTPQIPGGQSARFYRALELAGQGHVDSQYVLEEAQEDAGRIQEVLGRLAEAQKAAAEAQAQAAGAGAGGEGAPAGGGGSPEDILQKAMAFIGS